jgi:mannitol-1-/sugar-/sorbitol-6-phosphatase
MAEVRAVLLDMDGTLVDSNAAVARAWAYWSGLRSVDLTEIARVTPGRPAMESIAELAPWLSPAQRAADAAELLGRERADVVDIVATPGALDLVAALRAWAVPYAVVTSADRELARIRLTAAGIEPPPVLVTSEDVGRGKPDPEGYLAAAARLGVAPADCLVVEDAPAGVQAGRAAGALVAGLYGVPGADLDVPDLDVLRGRLSPTGPGTLLLDDRDNFPKVVVSTGI